MSNKHNRPQIQLRTQGQRGPAPSSVISPTKEPVLEETETEVDEHDLGAQETDQAEAAPETEVVATEVTPDAELVTEAPVRSSTVLSPRRASAQSAEVEVTPLITVNRIRIGQPWHHFERGKKVSVPREIIPFLVERGILAPGTR